MKKLIVALMLLTTLVSCGKNNSVSSNSTSATTSPISVTGAVETQLASIIDNNQFGNGRFDYYSTWNQLITAMPNISYKYGTVSTSSSCRTVAYIFQFCGSTSNTSNSTVTKSVTHSSVDLASKMNELKAIINSRSYIQVSGTSFYIRTVLGKVYIIDTAYPMQANPVVTPEAVFLRAE